MNDPVHIMGFSLPRTEVFSLLVVGLVLGAGLVAIVVSLVEERRKARRAAESARTLCCENPMVI
ncbi:MAG: hypothetical protein NNA20_13605 [Nitrospira sp.]|nr:hypothetical protein [Nitrospira sp.]MCP9443607.1 hypothetical protein [Nitrospira sp.]